MNFLKINKPDVTIINSCINLANDINQFDRMVNPIFEYSEFNSTNNLPILYYATTSNELSGFIGISLINETEIELCGFVLPKYRNLKVASRLLEMVFDDYESYDIKIPLIPNNILGKHFLQSYNAKYETTECIMELERNNYNFSCNEINLSESSNGQYKAYINNVEVGVASVYDNDPFIIHNVEIYEDYRGQKYGQALIHTLLTYKFKKYNKASLHVTKENAPAFNLYTKLGFNISKQLEYYLL